MSSTQPQPPGIPDLEQLRLLHPAVAITFLIFLALVVVLWYFGATIRDRLTPKRPSPPAGEPPAERAGVAQAIATSAPPVATASFDRAAQVEDLYRGNLLAQIEKLEARVAAVERKNEELDRKNDELHRENVQLRADLDRARWQR
ncbi:hypothetical protein DMP17_22245 [Pseudonocardia sp. TMWB2A]|uniref:cell division protein ZapB n=1 Tax=Pseudonocardia sp. TMWB2A TaxID=687430 RepID=UPI00307F049F